MRVAPVGFVRDEHRDVIAEIANELLRVEGTSIAITIAVTDARGRGLGPRRQPPARRRTSGASCASSTTCWSTAFPGVSGFKYERRPPHRVEGGACVPAHAGAARASGASTTAARGRRATGPILAHCQELARQLVAALRDLERCSPTRWRASSRPCRRRRAASTPAQPTKRRARGGRRLSARRAPRLSARSRLTKPRMSSFAKVGMARKHSRASVAAALAARSIASSWSISGRSRVTSEIA